MKSKKQQVKKKKMEGKKANPSLIVKIDPPSQVGNIKESKESVAVTTQSPQQVVEASQPMNGNQEQVSPGNTFMTPVSGQKRPRPEGSIGSQEKNKGLIFRKCTMCTQIRSTLKLEIAESRKTNSLLREQIKNLKKDKVQAQSSVTFMQSIYRDLEIKHKEQEKKYTIALSKINNINHILK